MDGIRRGVAPESPAPVIDGETRGEVKGEGILKWEEGMEVEGAYVGMRTVNSPFGPAPVTDIDFRDGHRSTFNTPVALATLLANVAHGSGVVIRCTGKVESPNGPRWDFKVFGTMIAKPETLPA